MAREMRAASVTVTGLNKNREGFTLVEVLVAILILMIGMIGLLQSINLALEVNLRSQLRSEASLVGERAMNELRGKGFDNISVSTVTGQIFSYGIYQVPSKLRGSTRNYTIARETKVLSTSAGKDSTKELTVVATWTYKGVTYENRVVSPISILR